MKKILLLIFFGTFLNSTAQNYTEAQNVYESYFDSKYEPHLPIKDCIMIIDHETIIKHG